MRAFYLTEAEIERNKRLRELDPAHLEMMDRLLCKLLRQRYRPVRPNLHAIEIVERLTVAK